MLVCHCNGVSDRAIRRSVRAGAVTPELVARTCGAGACCGGCRDAVQEILTAELTAINQYFVHAKMCENWGYQRLYKKKWEESLGEMKDADRIVERILFLDGTPNMQRLSAVRVGEDPIEQHRLDLALELAAVERYNRAIELARAKNDAGTRELLEHLLEGEEHSIDWLEAQLHLVETVGRERYLAEQMHE
jgi:bacterioferritin